MSDHDELTLRLHYRHGRGALADHFDALAQGRALGAREAGSDRVVFPPPPGTGQGERIELSGLGTVKALTRGPAVLPVDGKRVEACFALVALDGAHNLSFARILESDRAVVPGDRVRLTVCASPAPHPSRAACFVPDADAGGEP